MNNENEQFISGLSKKGYRLIKDFNFDQAIETFNQILNVDPQNNYALVGIGDAYRKKKEYSKAVPFYKKCLESHPGNNYALFGLAECYHNTGQSGLTIEIWKEYLEHDPDNINVITRLADAYRKTNDFEKSEKYFKKALEIEPENPYALTGLGHLYFDFKRYSDSLAFWKRLESINRINTDIRVITSIGNCYRKLKDFENGIKYFNKALEMDKQNFYALYGMADCFRGLGIHKESLKYWNKILQNDSGNKVILTRAGDAYRIMKDYEAAEKYYTNALKIGFDIYAEIGLAMTKKALGNYSEAIEKLNNLLETDKSNYRIYLELSECHSLSGNRQAALDVLNGYILEYGANEKISSAIMKYK